MAFLDYDGLGIFWRNVKNALTGKQDTITTDSSLTIKNNVMGVSVPVKGVTQQEYDALSTEEKNTGLYIITDK